jgi:hypothetical protein
MKAVAVAFVVPAVLLSLSGLPACGQFAISAQSGLIHFTEGQVFVQDKAIVMERGVFPLVGENQTLRTVDGMAEVLLNPGVFLRVGNNSSFRMVSTQLTASKVELVSGEAVIEAMEVNKKSSVTLSYGDVTVSVKKRGVYRLNAAPPVLRVFEGQALVQSGRRQVQVGRGRMLAFDGSWAARKFEAKLGEDDLDRWSLMRAGLVARSSISAARSLRSRRGSWTASGWGWDPYLLMFGFVPWRGYFEDPYGFWYSSPQTVDQFYTDSGGQPQPRAPARLPDSREGERATAYVAGESAMTPAPATTQTTTTVSAPAPVESAAPRSQPDRGPR